MLTLGGNLVGGIQQGCNYREETPIIDQNPRKGTCIYGRCPQVGKEAIQ
jgi:hypothetical protein